MQGLILHAGAEHVERSALSLVPMPAATSTYRPVGHGQFVDIVEDQLARIGFRFGSQAFGLMKDGSRFFGVAQLLRANEADGFALTVGMRASLDKSMAPSVSFGSHVFVCDNMAFCGEIVITRKQTTYIERDLPLLVGDAVANVRSMSANQDSRFDLYKNTRLSKRDADAAIIEMLRRGSINTSRVEKVVDEWDNPSREHGDRSVWRLFNAATHVLKEAPLVELPRRTITLQGVCDELVGFAPDLARAA